MTIGLLFGHKCAFFALFSRVLAHLGLWSALLEKVEYWPTLLLHSTPPLILQISNHSSERIGHVPKLCCFESVEHVWMRCLLVGLSGL